MRIFYEIKRHCGGLNYWEVIDWASEDQAHSKLEARAKERPDKTHVLHKVTVEQLARIEACPKPSRPTTDLDELRGLIKDLGGILQFEVLFGSLKETDVFKSSDGLVEIDLGTLLDRADAVLGEDK